MNPKIEILPKVKEVLRAEADAINAVKIDSSYEEAINILFESSGKIITTGMGKAGFVAQKFVYGDVPLVPSDGSVTYISNET